MSRVAQAGPGRAADVVVAGNAGVDTNVFLRATGIDFEVEANFTENLDCAGQAGVYAARSYAALGFRTAFIGHVGDDWPGRMVREAFAQDGIDTELLGHDPAGTARSVNLIYADGRRKNFYDGKGHFDLSVDLAACRALLAPAKLLHVHLANWTRTLLPLARELQVPIACDLQDIVALDDPYRADYLRQADILFASAVNHPDPAPLIRALFAAGPARLVVCGMGAEGCALGTREAGRVHIRRFPALDLPEPVVDTNGAGDSLAAGFLSSHVLKGLPLEEAILRGQLAARHACAQRATSARQITGAQLEALASRLSPAAPGRRRR
ncbi:MAG TPA: carbohydrate kinase family protein [Geothrix sp.]|nr:carbohydrate kinase family protein [Geothrix sp.]